jgi:hypothetical protein
MVSVSSNHTLSILLDLQYLLMRIGYLYLITVVQAADIVVDRYLSQIGQTFVIIVEIAAILDHQSIIHLP